MSDLVPFFSGEIQFRRYSDTSTQGQQVVFAVADREALSSFIGKEGKRFAAVLVELGDDEMPVQPQPKKDTRGPLCREACDYCEMPEFQAWVAHKTGNTVANVGCAKKFIIDVCQVESRKDLDMEPYAGSLFRNDIRIPFMRWQRERSHFKASAIAGY